MQLLRHTLSIVFILMLFCAGRAQALGTSTYESCHIKYQNMDQNGDCVITREEWRGSERDFENQDRNRDGVLSGEEVRWDSRSGYDYGNRDAYGDRDARSFSYLDRNRDNVISRNEWGGSSRTFKELDCNRDSLLTESEFTSRVSCNASYGNGSFQYLDTNRDGYISRAEWNGNYQAFVDKDCNRDSLLSPTEFNSRGRCNNLVNSGTFQFLDTNNDGYLESYEWNGDMRTFNNKDCNRDGRISRGEFFTSRCSATTCDYACLFRELDNNGDGLVERSEWRSNAQTFDRLDFNGDNVLTERELSNISNRAWQTKSGVVLNTVDSILNSVLYNR